MSNPPANSTPPTGTDGTTGKQTVSQAGQTTPQTSTPTAEVLALQLQVETLKAQVTQNEVQAGQAEQKPSAEQQKAIDELTIQLTEVYVNQIKGSKLYTDEELKVMDVNQLKAAADVVQRQNVQNAKQGTNPSETSLGLPDSSQGDTANSKTKSKEPFDYDPKTGTWKG